MPIITKSIADSQYFSNNSFTYILESFQMLKFFMNFYTNF